ncbi:IS21 family transposase [Pedobacter sp. WC2423]|uniref:IS21 family transposase n=1 Tax=Pedobacter sp. WC2423 TaxID=3234142 RepID=UPI003465DF2C
MNAFLRKFMMYYDIKRMHLDGRSISQISKALGCNRRTVKKYLDMEDEEFESFLKSQSTRGKLLLPYETFVRERLELYRDTSAAQMHDWLKEHHAEFPQVNQKTIFNFVKWVRHQHHLPFERPLRDYSAVEDAAYGMQGQIDFGEYNMRSGDGKRVKIYFFTLVLSRSRFKYVCFSCKPFTSSTAITAHESAFKYIKGIPDTLVYDQDKVFISNENHGELILTAQFKAYVRDRKFKVHMCRKADPESKGKIENVVKYIKQNFLYNRAFHDLETLNEDGLKWLERTANRLDHALTKKSPLNEWQIEQDFLRPFEPIADTGPAPVLYSVRKDNMISWKSNLYSLPLGTYTGRGSQIAVSFENGYLVICGPGQRELCRHAVAEGIGLKIINTDHKRDKSAALAEMTAEVCKLISDGDNLRRFISAIRADKPRYLRDQLILLREVITSNDHQLIEKGLLFCLQQGVNSANDFKALISKFKQQAIPVAVTPTGLNPLNGSYPPQALLQPQVSRIDDYQQILNQLN